MLRLPFRLIANLFILIGYLWSSFWAGVGKYLRRHRSLYVELELESSYPLGSTSRGIARWISSPTPTFIELRRSIKRLIEEDEVFGVVIKTKSMGMGPARMSELSALFDALREAGKHVVMHTDSASTREIPLLMSADDVLLTPAGRIYMFGYRFDEVFAAELLEKLGVVGQFIHLGAFKTATHRMHKTQMTSPQRLMMRQLHDGLMRSLTERVEARRGLSRARVLRALSDSPLDGVEAEQLGIVSARVFSNRLGRWLQQQQNAQKLPKDSPLRQGAWSADAIKAPRLLGEELDANDMEDEGDEALTKSDRKSLAKERKAYHKQRVRLIEMDRYLAGRPDGIAFKRLIGRKKYLGLLDFSGNIVMGNEGASPLGGGAGIQPDEVNPALERLRKDSRCLGVLIHINSPGGSALASDLMWQEIQRLRHVKPVVCWISDVGASGGYYMACGADRIVCSADTITGSIGVITGKVSIGRALEKLHVYTESIYDDESALFTSTFEPLPPRVMENFRDDARAFYRRFLERVGQARRIDRRRLHRYARGRVYLGSDALARGLVDDLGGFDAALKSLYELCDIPAESVPLEFMEHRKQNLRDVVSGSITSMRQPHPVERIAMSQLHAPLSIAAWLEREPLLALLPFSLDHTP